MALNATSASTGQAEASGPPDGAQPRSQVPGAPCSLRQGRGTQLPGPGGPHPSCLHRLCSSSQRPPMESRCAPGLPANRSCYRLRRRPRRRPRRLWRRSPYRSHRFSSQRHCSRRSHQTQALASWSPPRLPPRPSPWLPTRSQPQPRLQLPLRPCHPHLRPRPRPSKPAHAETRARALPGARPVRMVHLERVFVNGLQLP